jgi:hypothetical protein
LSARQRLDLVEQRRGLVALRQVQAFADDALGLQCLEDRLAAIDREAAPEA